MADISGSLWQVAALDPAVRDAISESRRKVVELFTARLGRPALVSDLHELGDKIPVIAGSSVHLTGDMALANLLHGAA
jgi:hypothetical protein